MASSNNPSVWSTDDVVAWLRKCKLDEFAATFLANEVDGSLLLNDGLDDSMVKELIPNFKHRILFNNERKKLKEMFQSCSENFNNNVVALATSVPPTEPDPQTTYPNYEYPAQSNLTHLPRVGAKATCKWTMNERDIVHLDIGQLIQPSYTIHTTLCVRHAFNCEVYDMLLKPFEYLCAPPQESDHQQLDACFHVLVDEPLDASILIKNIHQYHCLKSYVIDSLKRFHSLSDVMQVLSSCFDLPSTETDPFLNIVDQINKHMLLVCTVESLTSDSQRFLGNLIQKNDLPIPLAFYTPHEFKINFNSIIEPLCFTRDRFMLLLGSKSAKGLGKTSLIPYIFPDKRKDSLNIDNNRIVRDGGVDVVFAKLLNKHPYAVFDVHGTMNTINEDLITAIQHYCSIQILCVTEADLHQNQFLTSTMNYSTEIRSKPTIVVVFVTNYDDKNFTSTKVVQEFETKFQQEQWPNVIFMAAPILKEASMNSAFSDARRAQRLRQSFANCFHQLEQRIDHHSPRCQSIFAIQALYVAIKSSVNVSPSPLCNMTILSQLDALFGHLNDKTPNLQLVTPVSYLDGAILKCEKTLSTNWDQPAENIQAQLERFRLEYQNITKMPVYTDFFIKLITTRPYVELLITEKYLEQWRSQFEPMLLDRMISVKNDAMAWLSRIKQLEEQIQQEINQNNEAHRKTFLDLLQVANMEYKTRQQLVSETEDQLANIDLTIGLFCDEIFAVYEHFPKLFDADNLFVRLAQKLAELMYKGFSFHILRGRPLRCHSKLIHECLRYVQHSTNKTPLVLTVIGEQSSAKSSLLNSTFGCNFRVSAGRCTIGIYLSIVRWRDNAIVIFDTEGLLSLEESGSIFDNQMVSMAMLSSHVVLINHKGEFSSNLEHLIGMSFYAKIQIRSPLKPKLLFILRDQSDILATGVFFRQLSKFKENLYNDSKFLKSSIDDELEIDHQNVILLPNAFSSDTNLSLGIEQTWRNSTFPMKVLDLRKMIFACLVNVNLEVYIDLSHLYQKIACNWNAIDKLGPNLLACKTLYELSIMNELRDIANDIVVDYVNKVSQEGRQHIDRVLAAMAQDNQSDLESSYFIDQFNIALQVTHQKMIQNALVDFHSKTQRSCFPPELKRKVELMIQPPIAYVQVMLQDEFNERLYKARRDARISSAQRRLIDSIQCKFDQNTNLPVEELEIIVETAYEVEFEACHRTVRPEYETPEQITIKILKFYNSTLQSKTANIRHDSIYNWLHSLDAYEFQKGCRRFDGTWECMVKREPQEAHMTNALIRAFKKFFLGNSPDDYVEELWKYLGEKVCQWFNTPYNYYKNKKLLSSIFAELLPQLRTDVGNLVGERFQSSSDARVISHMLELIQNLLNNDIVKRNIRHLSLHHFVSDVAMISLKLLIDQAVKIEQDRQKQELEKAEKDLANWKGSLKQQIQLMQNSFEQGKNMAGIVAKEIFEQVGQLLLDKILYDVTAEIIKNQFINHDSMQRQAYEESIGEANGEKILKYVLDINRFFLELSLREINTSLMTILHSRMMDAEKMIVRIINKSNDIVQTNETDNIRLIADAIERGILKLNLFENVTEKRFALHEVITLPIENMENFKRGFKVILLRTANIREQVAILTEKVKGDVLSGCKTRLSKRLGCQSRCPGCGAKCSRPEPHDEELFQQWHECQCRRSRACKCVKPPSIRISCHESSHHLAQAFYGTKYYKKHTPVLKLCYQEWTTTAMMLEDDEMVFPLQKYYHIHQPEWYTNLNTQATRGTACHENLPPAEQRRAWMVVRRVLLRHYKPYGMIDNGHYDENLYPNVKALPDDYEPTWNDTDLG